MADETQTQSSSTGGGTNSQSAGNQSASGSQTSQSGATNSTQTQSQPSRPEYVPESHWDASANKVKDDRALASHFNEIIARDAAEQIRRLALPQSADAYKAELSSEFKMPDGVKFELSADDPYLAQARTVYHDIQTGKISGQQGFSKLLDLHAAVMTSAAQRQIDRHNAELAASGPNTPARIDAANTFFKAHLGEADGVEFMSNVRTAKSLASVERLIAKFTGHGGSNFSTRGREPPDQAGRATPEQIAKMSHAERLDYSRNFDQSKMPAWRDPRAA